MNIDLFEMYQNRSNPFDYIESDQDIEIFASSLIEFTTPENQKRRDPFWERSTINLLTAVMSYLLHYVRREDRNASNIRRLLFLSEEDSSDSEDLSVLDKLFRDVEAEDPSSFAVKRYKIHQLNEKVGQQAIALSCLNRISWFDFKTEEMQGEGAS